MDKLHSLTRIASMAVSAWRFVDANGGHAASAVAAIGISEQSAAIGTAFSVLNDYSAPVEAAEALAVGDLVKPAADGSGRASKGSAGDCCGRVLAAAATGKLAEVRFLELAASAVSAIAAVDRAQPWSMGTRICDWTGAFTNGAGAAIDATTTSPDGASVLVLNGAATVDTGADGGNQYGDVVIPAIGTGDLKTLGFWARCAPRNPARKGYRNVPVKFLLAQDNTFANYISFGANVRADGRYRFYVVNMAAASATYNAFVLGVNTISIVRARPSVDMGANASPLLGTAPLQVGEKLYLGGIYKNPRAKPLAMVRFDDGLNNLYSQKLFTLAAPYVGQSGVTVQAGAYTAFELVSAFGHKAACFILTRHTGTGAPFESVAGLTALQAAGWEICWQTHANPTSSSNQGARLLGPLGANWFPAANNNYAADGTITTVAANGFASGPGQGTPITLNGTPPAPLAAGQTYWVRATSANAHKLFLNEADSLNNVNPITFAGAAAANWGWSFAGSTVDASAINAEFAQGVAAMKAWGFGGWMHWAPNQGAIDPMLEDAWYAIGFRTCFSIGYNSNAATVGVPSQYNSTLGQQENMSILSTICTSSTAYGTDGAGATEAGARAFVQNGIRLGDVIQNYHHAASAANTLVLCAYLDELKLRQDIGELEVATPTRIANYIDAMRLRA